MYINERNPIARRSLEAAKRFDKKLTLVPVIFLCLRSCGMMRFAIYSSSSVHESKPVRNAQEVLIYFQVSVPTVCSCYTREWSGEEYAWNNRERNRERDRTHRLLGIWRNLQTQFLLESPSKFNFVILRATCLTWNQSTSSLPGHATLPSLGLRDEPG